MSTGNSMRYSMPGWIGALWGIVGLSGLLSKALLELFPKACEIGDYFLAGHHWCTLAGFLVFMGYVKGYRVFQRRFSPRVAARARYLRAHPTWMRVLLAPLFCMGLFHSSRKRKIVAYSLFAMIVLLVVLVRHLPQPWQGIIHAGVLLGLGWGLASLWFFAVKALSHATYDVSPETQCSRS